MKVINNAANFLVGNDDDADCANGPLGSDKLQLPFLKYFHKDILSLRDYQFLCNFSRSSTEPSVWACMVTKFRECIFRGTLPNHKNQLPPPP